MNGGANVDNHLPLQVGCWDGTVAVWRLQPEEAADASPGGRSVPATGVLLSHARTDPSPLRAVAWAPAVLAASAADGLGRAVYMAAGNQGALSIWDARSDKQMTPLTVAPCAVAPRGWGTGNF